MTAVPPPPAPHSPVLTEDERTWAVLAHVGSFVAAALALGALAPLLVLLVKGSQSPYVRHHALESLQFQLNALVWIAISVVLMFFLIGFVLLLRVDPERGIREAGNRPPAVL